jgi:hypothetical protein
MAKLRENCLEFHKVWYSHEINKTNACVLKIKMCSYADGFPILDG